MSSPVATAPGITHTEAPAAAASRLVLALVILVTDRSLACTGHRLLIQEGETVKVGRHDPARLTDLGHFAPHRPGLPMPPPSPAGGLPGASVSHVQFLATATKDGLFVEVIGKRPTMHNGQPFTKGLVRPDQTIMLVGDSLFLCMWTPMDLPMPAEGVPLHPFGEADASGIYGESAASWALRKAVDFAAGANQDVLVLGESGTGKTAVSRAIHRLSPRSKGPVAFRSCTNFSQDLVASELFGTKKGIIGSGKESFEGVFPEGNGGAIILDEIGLAPLWLQAALLTVLDDGVFTVIGAARPTKVDLLIIGTTNADPSKAFRPDFGARFAIRVHVPSVGERRDDIGFILLHFLKEADVGAKGELPSSRKISPTFMDFLVRHPLTTNAREIRNMMYAALAASPPGELRLPSSLLEGARPTTPPPSVTPPSAPPVSQPRESTPEGASRGGRPKEAPARSEREVREALEASGGDATSAAARLGVSRGKMLRIMEKLGVKGGGR